jgi:hypothetical protein
MSKLFSVAFLFILQLFFSGALLAQENKEQEKLIALSVRKFEWMKQNQLDSLDGLLHDEVKYIHSNGWIQSKTEVIEDFKSKKLIMHDVVLESSECRVDETTAIITGSGQFSGVMNSQTFSVKLLFTEVYVQKGGRWLLMSRHANKLNN